MGWGPRRRPGPCSLRDLGSATRTCRAQMFGRDQATRAVGLSPEDWRFTPTALSCTPPRVGTNRCRASQARESPLNPGWSTNDMRLLHAASGGQLLHGLQLVLPRGSPRVRGVPAEPAAQLAGPFTGSGEALFQIFGHPRVRASAIGHRTPHSGRRVLIHSPPMTARIGGGRRASDGPAVRPLAGCYGSRGTGCRGHSRP